MLAGETGAKSIGRYFNAMDASRLCTFRLGSVHAQTSEAHWSEGR
ncbi:hypothetical protein SLEP1_g10655 [Rubroshorea leprosula]|uniref:Uncharacterized protein n=1 Tax=Rubroshorea leprosula TaxID=152421 RepID=A0AAV5IEN0_9ROSI|nr:hypothetical protein SLEP1_g10655 [Rubroshorea leprosula]